MRLDKWLKLSRLIKRRTVANEACDNQSISVNGRTAKASYQVQIGDQIELKFGQRSLLIEVLSIDEFAGKEMATAMYRELRSS